ncbi:MAG: DUF4976 domain-containing protein [Candidatus Omnitrophota bacterium]|nr:MAG: DUF4976 domain-containing protein [Candidatus Omnitrophota bacterium]
MKNTRRYFLKTVCVGIPLINSHSLHSWAKKRTYNRPNFLFILTDDQCYDALGCTGNPLIHTPTLDSLAARGIRFENAFVTCSICSPSRAVCLTGRYGSANGVMKVGGGLNEDEKTIVHYLRKAGYFCGMVGKWHLANSPAWCGFDVFDYFESNGRYYNRSVFESGEKKVVEGFIEDYNAARSCDFLEKAASNNQPFFLFHCTQVPHMNHEFDWNARPQTLTLYNERDMPVPAAWQDDLSGKPPYLKESRSRTQALKYGYDKKEAIQRHKQRYYAAITEMDASLGKLIDKLDKLGLRENTIIIVMGDNGWFLGEHGFTSKVLPYEESIRVPMIICGPGIETGVTRNLVLNADLAPTILELANIAVPHNLHGHSLHPLLKKDGNHVWREAFLYEALESQLGSWPLLAVRTNRWKYIQTFDLNDPTKLVFEELYDLECDPTERLNRVYEQSFVFVKEQLADELVRIKERLEE